MSTETKRPAPLLAALERLGTSDHLCMTYRTREQELAAVIPYIRLGLERREECVYIADDVSRAEVLSALQSAGIATGGTPRVLKVLSRRETYLGDGHFDPDRILAWIAERTEAAVRGGFTAFRIVGEMTGVAGIASGVQRLAEFEAKLNDLFAGRPVSALCEYDARAFPAEILREVITTHPLVVVGETVCRNPSFVAPKEYLSPRWPEREVEWILENLLRLQRAEDELRESEERYRALSRHLLEMQERERHAIARNLHDDLGQILTAIKLSLKGASRSREKMADSLALVDEAIRQTRSLALDLRPSVLDDLGVAAALQQLASQYAARGGLEIRLDTQALERVKVPPAVQTACFRLVQEAFTNIARHAGARRVDVTIRAAGGAIEIVVRDDGRGFDVAVARKPAGAGAGLGLLGMEERISLAGGQLTIESAPGSGTTIRAHFSPEAMRRRSRRRSRRPPRPR